VITTLKDKEQTLANDRHTLTELVSNNEMMQLLKEITILDSELDIIEEALEKL
jgi:hypothetical protein